MSPLKEDAMTLMRNTLATAAVLGALAAAPCAHAADPCKLEISGNDLMQYDKPELSAPATCKQVTVTLHHTGKLPREAMGHNWVLVNAADLAAVATAGLGAGLAIGGLGLQVPNDGSSAQSAVLVTSSRQWTTVTVDCPDPAPAVASLGYLRSRV